MATSTPRSEPTTSPPATQPAAPCSGRAPKPAAKVFKAEQASQRLPTEILGKILAFLVPELPDVAERPVKPLEEFLSSRSALFHPSLMSSRLEALARPLLFKTIAILEADSLLLLWRTLRSRPDLGRFVRQVAFWITNFNTGAE
jgi:hypothetical protein